MGSRSYPSPAFAPIAISIAALCACGPSQPPPTPTPTAAEAQKACEAIERLLDAGKDDLALAASESLARSRPDDSMAWEMLARSRMAARRSSGDIADAWERVAALRPDSPGTQSAAGVTAAAAERWERALAFDERAEALEPGNPQHPMQRAIVLRALGRNADSVAAARRAAALAPVDCTVQITLARSLRSTGDATGAKASALQAVRLAPQDAALRIAAADLVRECGAADEAMQLVLPLAEPASANPDAVECLARCQTAARLHAQAARSWQRVADGPLGSWRACLAVSESLLAAGDRAGATEWLARARERRAPMPELDRVETLLNAAPKP